MCLGSSNPVSNLIQSIKVVLRRPLDRVPCVGSQCKMDYSPKATPCLYSLQLTVKDGATSDNVRVVFQNGAVRMLAKVLSLELENEQAFIKRLFEVNEPLFDLQMINISLRLLKQSLKKSVIGETYFY